MAWSGSERARRLVRFASAAMLVIAALELVLFVLPMGPGAFLIDYNLYQDRTASWMVGDGFYRARQLAGPYTIEMGDSMYPPVLLVLTLPFAFGLPAILWWAVPLGLVAASIRAARVAWWGWLPLAALLLYPRTWAAVLYGNPSMWVFAFLAAGTVWRWPAAFVPLKPTLAPFALIGVRSRSWWLALAFAALVCVPFGGAWLDYARALLDARSADLLYLAGELPIAAVIVAVLRRPPPAA